MKELIKPEIQSPDNGGLYEALCEVHVDVCNCDCSSKSKFFADDDQGDIIF